jgi:hypothetical protein
LLGASRLVSDDQSYGLNVLLGDRGSGFHIYLPSCSIAAGMLAHIIDYVNLSDVYAQSA